MALKGDLCPLLLNHCASTNGGPSSLRNKRPHLSPVSCYNALSLTTLCWLSLDHNAHAGRSPSSWRDHMEMFHTIALAEPRLQAPQSRGRHVREGACRGFQPTAVPGCLGRVPDVVEQTWAIPTEHSPDPDPRNQRARSNGCCFPPFSLKWFVTQHGELG